MNTRQILYPNSPEFTQIHPNEQILHPNEK